MSRVKTLLLLVVSISTSQLFTLLGFGLPHVYLHDPGGWARPLLMAGLAIGLLALLFRRGDGLSRGERVALTIGTAGGLANLVDLVRLGAVADFIPLGSEALASPGDVLIAVGFLGFVPISLYQARRGYGFYALYTEWRNRVCAHLRERLPLWSARG